MPRDFAGADGRTGNAILPWPSRRGHRRLQHCPSGRCRARGALEFRLTQRFSKSSHARHPVAAQRPRRRQRLADRGYTLDIAAFSALEAERRAIQTRTEEAGAPPVETDRRDEGGRNASAVMAEVGRIGDEMKREKPSSRDPGAPVRCWACRTSRMKACRRQGQADNVGCAASARRQFDFEVKDHVDVGTPLGLDFRTGAKRRRASDAARSIARLHRARAVHDRHARSSTAHRDALVHREPEILYGTGQLPKFADDMFRVERAARTTKDHAIPDLHVGNLADQHRARVDRRRVRTADQADRAFPVLPLGSRFMPRARAA